MASDCEVTSTRTIYNHLIKVPTAKRLQACERVLDIIDSFLGKDSYMYESITTFKVVCLVHSSLMDMTRGE